MKLFRFYIVGAIITFGFAYNVDFEPSTQIGIPDAVANATSASVCALGWPLYFVTKAFTPLKPAQYKPQAEAQQ